MQLYNTFFLGAGIIALFFSYFHVKGVRRFKPSLTALPEQTQHGVSVFLYQPAVVLLISGIVLVEMAFMPAAIPWLAGFIVAVNFGNLSVFALYALMRNRQMLRNHALHMGAMILWLGIIIDGIVF